MVAFFIPILICYFQSRYEINKVYASYEQLKDNYKDILTDDDIQEIFKDDEILNQMKKTINKSEKIYLGIWVVSLIIILVIIENVSVSPTYQTILDLVQKNCVIK